MTIGRFYRVPCIQLARQFYASMAGEWIPVLGSKHEDIEHLNFEQEHWHIDWRFAPLKMVRVFKGEDFGKILGVVICEPDLRGNRSAAAVGEKLMKMKRETPLFPAVHAHAKTTWSRLQNAYVGHVAKCNVCPHRGLPLDGAPAENGARVCAGHGLAWNIETGVLQRRPVPATEPQKP